MYGLRLTITVGDQEMKVCSFKCERELKEKHGNEAKEDPSAPVRLGRL